MGKEGEMDYPRRGMLEVVPGRGRRKWDPDTSSHWSGTRGEVGRMNLDIWQVYKSEHRELSPSFLYEMG